MFTTGLSKHIGKVSAACSWSRENAVDLSPLFLFMIIYVIRADPLTFSERGLDLKALKQGFLTGGTCTPWGYEQPNQGVRDEESEYQLF